jgi:hypothetical protein
LTKGGEPTAAPGDAKYFLTWIDTVLGMIGAMTSFDRPEQQREVMDVRRRAREVYAALAAEAPATSAVGEGTRR